MIDIGFEVELTGFETAEVDLILDEFAATDASTPADRLPAPSVGPAITRPGDVWLLGKHRLACGDARDATAYEALLDGDKADVIFTDPPYNVPIAGHVSGLGHHHHADFAMASGEMSEVEFMDFLTTVLGHAAAFSRDGALHYVCMDWRHLYELLSASRSIYGS